LQECATGGGNGAIGQIREYLLTNVKYLSSSQFGNVFSVTFSKGQNPVQRYKKIFVLIQISGKKRCVPHPIGFDTHLSIIQGREALAG
ncbi:MAG: hypothetical protein IIW26_05580, partial [Tidjanibacter sp.]|nr:hypothetical protein [Tidjanibacter sp.]